jgi:Gluconate 2-dehydrogenase subunit 3
MPFDFREAGHLPHRRAAGDHADPDELPRQRKGKTPQMHGRYPDFDVLAESDHWDELTRRVVLDRIENVPPFRFFDRRERETLKAFCDVVTDQHREPRIPVLAYVDEKLFEGNLDGWQYEDMPDDRDTWRLVAAGLEELARSEWRARSFKDAPLDVQTDIVKQFAAGTLRGDAWRKLNVRRAWTVVMRTVLASFYSHPWAWNEIGFGGPAYPRGYAAFGSPGLGGEAESWEARESVHADTVRE